MNHIRAHQLAEWLSDNSRPQPVLLDVRESWEVETCALPASVHIPMHLVPLRCGELDTAREIVVLCHHGARSMQVAHFLQSRGFEHVANIAGGINAWSAELDPGVARY